MPSLNSRCLADLSLGASTDQRDLQACRCTAVM